MVDITRVERELESLKEQVISYRRDLHRIPEESFAEFETTAYLERELSRLPDIVLSHPAATGLIATLRGQGAGSGCRVALRADIDALKVEEKTGCAYASTHPGLMHACGHDGHMSMLLGAVHALYALREEWSGEMLFFFQHAEEHHPGGARDFAHSGILEGVDYIVGTHIWGTLPLGVIGLRPGAFMAAPDNFEILIRGRGGHAAMPHENIDAVTTAAHIILALQTLVSRQIDPVRQVVLSVTSMNGGLTYNVMPDEVTLKGTVRVLDEDLRPVLQAKMTELVQKTGEVFGAECETRFLEGYSVVDNDEALTVRLAEVFRRHLPEVRVEQIDPQMCGEDFSLYQKYIPGVYFFTGAGNPERGLYPQHHSAFQFDEDALAIGLRALVWSALSLLEQI
jgi:amidohydrolase